MKFTLVYEVNSLQPTIKGLSEVPAADYKASDRQIVKSELLL